MSYDNWKLQTPDSFFDEEIETEPCEMCKRDVWVENKYQFGIYTCLCVDCFNEKVNVF
jgi:hypothetical protein